MNPSSVSTIHIKNEPERIIQALEVVTCHNCMLVPQEIFVYPFYVLSVIFIFEFDWVDSWKIFVLLKSNSSITFGFRFGLLENLFQRQMKTRRQARSDSTPTAAPSFLQLQQLHQNFAASTSSASGYGSEAVSSLSPSNPNSQKNSVESRNQKINELEVDRF